MAKWSSTLVVKRFTVILMLLPIEALFADSDLSLAISRDTWSKWLSEEVCVVIHPARRKQIHRKKVEILYIFVITKLF